MILAEVQEGIVSESPIATFLHNMITDDPMGMFPFSVDSGHFTAINKDTCFTYWLCDCLNHFEGRLKMVGFHEAIWTSHYKQQLNEELIKAFVARCFPCINTSHDTWS